MATAPQEDLPRRVKGQQAPLWVIVAACVVLIGFMGFLFQVNFGPRQPPPLTPKEKENRTLIGEIVKRTNGDFSKVSEDDKKLMYKIAGPYGGLVYKDVKRELGI